MTCPHCGGLLKKDTINNVTPRAGQFIVIYGVPCCKCVDCGTVLYRGHVMQKLEKMVDDTPKAAGKVVMLGYPDSDMEVYNGH
ncbi:hypothetical protein I5Q82_16335 [Acutalibacter muris]|uniref:YgiT-type zinc finger domain-containing protein n=1 Tax=Acutalibacter muris TaxID=1796620 RepID=A0A1Z2XPC7_9FIRM|nr:hypothetical protein [Acutalibacter muris]ANU53033.1 hypothetical protein A4V00_02780 [Hungateiclostridiaceae bacterium KB18]ASB40293.1 hypothetical protein ADH66_06240 [Acutalibacter muris]QQR29584.1 hypothetical protein I5Q82_16335 [Acutalibacter muris]